MKKKTHNQTPQKPKNPRTEPPFVNMENTDPQEKPPVNPQSRSSQDKQDTTTVLQCEKQGKLTTLEKAGIVGNIFISLITLFLVGYNISAFKATVKSAQYADSTFKEMRKQFEKDSRPYIIMSRETKVDVITESSDLLVNCVIKNVGKSPALLLDSSRIGIETYPSENPEKLRFDGKIRRGNIYLEVGDTMNFTIGGVLPKKPDMYYEIIQGKRVPLAYGEILFKDIVSERKYSYTFCIRILNNGRYVPVAIHNALKEVN